MEEIQKKKIAGTALIVMSSIVVSRFTGFFREMLIPNMLGVNQVADAYNMAFRITGLMYDLLVGGAIAAALIPILTGYMAKDREEEGWKAVGTFINIVMLAMVLVSFLGILFAPQLVRVFALGFGGEATGLTVELTRILFPSVAFLMLAGVANGVLNSYQRFAAAAYGPSIYNIGSALSILLFYRYGVQSIAYGVLCSAIIYFLFQLTFAFKNLKFYKFRFYLSHEGFQKLFKLAIPALVSSAVVQLNAIISLRFATLFSVGSVTILQMCDRIWQTPYGIFAQGIGIALLPTLSAKLAAGEVDNFKYILINGLKTVLFLSIPSAVGFIILRQPIMNILKFTHRFDHEAVAMAGTVLAFFSIALLSQSMVTVLNRAFYANNNANTPLMIGIFTIVANTILSYLFYKYTPLGVGGMALAYSITSFVNAVLLLSILNRSMKGIYLKKLGVFTLKVLPASLLMGGILYLLNAFLPYQQSPKTVQVLYLVVQIACGAGIYFGIVLLMRVEEALYMYRAAIAKVGALRKRSK
ncbi:MAG: murein biosynthesis integral membrane protein MurJ [Clostridia bacterium]|nr:murein biosynthesis integral membrane protein MurJ [Clostridia bacterium]